MWRTHIEREIDDLASYPAVQLCTFAVLSGLTDWKVAKVRGNGLVFFLLFYLLFFPLFTLSCSIVGQYYVFKLNHG